MRGVTKSTRVAVVGGGISGLVCARNLEDNGYPVTVFDKGRAPGGRVSTRRGEVNQFDHGAQYLTARDPLFQGHVEAWLHGGIIEEWSPRIIRLKHTGKKDHTTPSRRFVGTPSMSAIPRHLSRGLDVRAKTMITHLERQSDVWLLRDETGEHVGEFATVVVATPPTQAAQLLSQVPCVASIAKAVRMSSCWTLMVELEQEVDPGYDAAFIEGDAVAWLARDGSKPGRKRASTWVLHASAGWSARHNTDDRAVVAEILETKMAKLLGLPELDMRDCQLHFWRFAAPIATHPERCVFNPTLHVGACGDWCAGARIEGAFLSGVAMADRITGNGLSPHDN